MTKSNHRTDHGQFCTWCYNGPGRRARGFWNAHIPIDKPMWAYALRSADGTFWETWRSKGGFVDEASAINAAREALEGRAK